MDRERFQNWCDKGILVMVLAVLVFGPLATGAVRPLEFLVIQFLVIATVLLWILRIWTSPTFRVLWPPVCFGVVAFVGYAIVRYQQADIEYAARQELIRILVYALLFFIILNNLHQQESIQLVTFTLIFLGMALSMYAVYQFATNSQYVWHFIKPLVFQKRGSGTYINPNHLAGFLEMLVPLALAYTLIGRPSPLLRVFLCYAALVILGGIGVTVSRGGWIASALTLACLFASLFRRRQYRVPVLIFLSGLVAAGAYAYSKAGLVQSRLENVLSTESPESGRIRLSIWRSALEIWKDHPWLGVGPAHFDHRFPAYRPADVQARPGFAHNDYLNTLADWGLIGTALVVISFALLFWGVFKTWRHVRREPSELDAKPSNRAAFVFGAFLGLLAILVHSFADFNMHIPANAIIAVTLMALLSGHLRFATERYWVNPRLLGRISATLIGLLVVAYLGHQACRRAREYVWLERAAKETAYTPKMISALQNAIAIEPSNFETSYALGEALRRSGWEADDNAQELISQATTWFQRGIRLNPYDPYNYMKVGMCLDWSGRHDEAAPYFEKALQCDPNNYYVLAHQGWHFFQIEDYETARKYFQRSLTLYHAWHNPIAANYLAIIDRKLKEGPPPAAK